MNGHRHPSQAAIHQSLETMISEEKPIDLELLDTTYGKDGRDDIVSTFLTHSRLLFDRIEIGFEQDDLETIRDVSHQIKGMSASVFAADLSNQAHELEHLAKVDSPDWHEMRHAYATLKKLFGVLSTFLTSTN